MGGLPFFEEKWRRRNGCGGGGGETGRRGRGKCGQSVKTSKKIKKRGLSKI